jgi:hypothetical protein
MKFIELTREVLKEMGFDDKTAETAIRETQLSIAGVLEREIPPGTEEQWRSIARAIFESRKRMGREEVAALKAYFKAKADRKAQTN